MAMQLGLMGALAGISLGMAWFGIGVDVREDPPAVVCAGDWVTACTRVSGGLELAVRQAPDVTVTFEGLPEAVALGYVVRAAGCAMPLATGEGTFVPLSQWPEATSLTFYALSGDPAWAEVSSVSVAGRRVAGKRGAYEVREGASGDGEDWPYVENAPLPEEGFRLTLTPRGECGGDYDLFGLWPQGGSTTAETFEFTLPYRPGEDPTNAFTLRIEGQVEIYWQAAFCIFQFAADDTVSFSIGDVTVPGGAGGVFLEGPEVVAVIKEGVHPMVGTYENWGGEAALALRRWAFVPAPAELRVPKTDVEIPWARGTTTIPFEILFREELVRNTVVLADGESLPSWVLSLTNDALTIDNQKFLESRTDSATLTVELEHRYRSASFTSQRTAIRVWRKPLEAMLQVDANNDGAFDAASPDAGLMVWAKESGQEGHQRLLDFSPIQLKLGEGFVEQLNLEREPGTFRVVLKSDAVPLNVLWTGMTNTYEPFYRSDVETCGPTLDASSATFPTQALPEGEEGLDIPLAFLKKAQASGGILMAETQKVGWGTLTVAVHFSGSPLAVFEERIPLSSIPIERMFARVNLRENTPPALDFDALPAITTHATCALYFLHGFNVDEDGALEWQKEMFRRLYRKNCRVLFYGVTWEGNVGAMDLNYHESVVNAFEAGERLAAYVRKQDVASGSLAPTNNVFMAHSLGNMVVASAIQDHGLKPAKVIMLNAAIPSEALNAAAFNTSPRNNGLVPDDWKTYASTTWCSCWHLLFTGSDLPQGKLTWRNRFSKLREQSVLNLYSTGDEVLEVGTQEPSFLGDGKEFGWHAWQAQELGKGKGPLNLYGSKVAGWSFRFLAPSAEVANSYTLDELRSNPVFDIDSRMMASSISTNDWNILLAHGIPALSCPVGNPVQHAVSRTMTEVNLNDAPMRPNGWRILDDEDDLGRRWLHSDIKNMDYFYTWKAFESIVNALP